MGLKVEFFNFSFFLPRTDHLGGVCRITSQKSRNHKKSIFRQLGLLSTKFQLQLKVSVSLEIGGHFEKHSLMDSAKK